MLLLTVLGRADLKTAQGTADLITAHLSLPSFSRPSRLPASPASLRIGGDHLALPRGLFTLLEPKLSPPDKAIYCHYELPFRVGRRTINPGSTFYRSVDQSAAAKTPSLGQIAYRQGESPASLEMGSTGDMP